MNIYLYLYISSVLFCLTLNLGVYDRFKRAKREEKTSCFVAIIFLLFLGPISVVINLYYLGVYVKIRVQNYRHQKEMERILAQIIEAKLIEALEASDIEVVDE